MPGCFILTLNFLPWPPWLDDQYRAHFEALGDKKRLSRFLFETGYARVFSSDIENGRKYLGRARGLGREIGDELAIAYADFGAMWDRMYWGEAGEARTSAQLEAANRISEVGQKYGDIWLASKGLLALAHDRMVWGQPGQARDAAMRLMALSRSTNDPRPRSMALWMLAGIECSERA